MKRQEVHTNLVGGYGTLLPPPQQNHDTPRNGRMILDSGAEVAQQRQHYEIEPREGMTLNVNSSLQAPVTITGTSASGTPVGHSDAIPSERL